MKNSTKQQSQKAKEIQEKKALNQAFAKIERDEFAVLTSAEHEALSNYRAEAEAANKKANAVKVNITSEEEVPVVQDTFLQRAEKLIKGDRQKDYGDKLANFAHIAMFFQAVLAPKLQEGVYISPEEVGMMMQGVKMARMIKSPDHADSVLDNAGYAGCIGELQAERLALKKPMGAITDSNSWMIPNVGS